MDALSKVRAKIKANFPAQKEAQLSWVKLNKYCLQSECKRFTVCRGLVEGQMFYEAWYYKTPLAFRLGSSDEAKQLCESHAINLKREPEPMTAAKARQLAEERQRVLAAGS